MASIQTQLGHPITINFRHGLHLIFGYFQSSSALIWLVLIVLFWASINGLSHFVSSQTMSRSFHIYFLLFVPWNVHIIVFPPISGFLLLYFQDLYQFLAFVINFSSLCLVLSSSPLMAELTQLYLLMISIFPFQV